MSSSCCNSNCGCGAGCKCGTSCSGGCKMSPDLGHSGERSTGETIVSGTGPEKPYSEGSEMGAGAEKGGCKCNPCTCNPCNCK